MKYLIVFFSFIYILNAQIYKKNSNVVVDTKAKLMWVDNISVIEVLKTHDEAINYCEELKLEGFTNWRIPKIEEFKLIVDKNNHKNYISKAFKYNVPDGYWAEESHWRTLWFYADYMHFVSGTAYFDSRHKSKYVRCVRNI